MKISKELLKGTTATMVLKVISEKDMYGYQIIQEIASRSNDVFKLLEKRRIFGNVSRDGQLWQRK